MRKLRGFYQAELTRRTSTEGRSDAWSSETPLTRPPFRRSSSYAKVSVIGRLCVSKSGDSSVVRPAVAQTEQGQCSTDDTVACLSSRLRALRRRDAVCVGQAAAIEAGNRDSRRPAGDRMITAADSTTGWRHDVHGRGPVERPRLDPVGGRLGYLAAAGGTGPLPDPADLGRLHAGELRCLSDRVTGQVDMEGARRPTTPHTAGASELDLPGSCSPNTYVTQIPVDSRIQPDTSGLERWHPLTCSSWSGGVLTDVAGVGFEPT